MKDFLGIFKLFLIWRLVLFVIAFLAPFFIKSFGNRFPYVKELIASGLPSWVWPFGNFDGVYYLRIAQNGYQDQYSQAFFPLYPLLIRIFTFDNAFLLTGLIISNICFILALYLVFKIFNLDFSRETSWLALVLLIVFPTSYYFGAVYTESLFLLLVAATVLLSRKGRFLGAGLTAAFASATKIIGFLLTTYLIVELILQVRSNKIKVKSWEFARALLGILLAPLGTVAYMIYLKVAFNNPLHFLTSQPAFGASRSDQPFVLLPQVLYRYFKILTTVSFDSQAYFNAFLEVLFTVVPLALLVIFFKKIRLSFWVFMMAYLILPTMTGTLLSMPRFALISFLLFPLIAQKFEHYIKFIFLVFILLAIVLVSLYTRGYWVA